MDDSFSSFVFVHMSYHVMMTFVLLPPCRAISNLSNQSRPISGWIFLFSVMRIVNISLLFSVFTSTIASTFNFVGFLFTATKLFLVFFISIGLIIGGIIVTGEPVSMINPIGCPWTNRMVLWKSTRLMPLRDWIWSISGHDSVLLPDVCASLIRLTVLVLHTLAKCPIVFYNYCILLSVRDILVQWPIRFSVKATIPVWELFLVGQSWICFKVWLVSPICSSSEELIVFLGFLFFGFLSPYFRL